MPKFSVVIPVYNRANSILPTLLSVKNQTFEDFECIIVNDGSSDSYQLDIVVKGLDDSRFKLVHRDNGGGGAARNTGIDSSKGEYIAFLDSDDYFLEKKLQCFNDLLDGNLKTIWYSYMLVDRGVGKYWTRPDRAIRAEENVGEYLFVSNQFIQTSTIVLPREAASKVRFDNSLRKGQDLDFCIRLAHEGYHFKMLEEEMTIWNDVTELSRTSRFSGYEAPILWLQKSKPILSKKAILGYQANILSYYIGWSKPWTALKFILDGYLRGGVSFKVTVRQITRTFMPKRFYRYIVAIFVSTFGRSKVD